MIDTKLNKRYCQSCGIPLPEYTNLFHGTNRDKSHNEEFCFYCLKNGIYTVNFTMEQVIGEWVRYSNLFNLYSGTHYSPQELEKMLNKRLPQLKRWKQKVETENIHYQSMNKVCRYIDRNLFKEFNPDIFYQMSNLSKFHFRRVFKSIMGENIGNYIQRLRLEHIAHLLLNTQMTLDELTKNTNYQTKASLAKAFRKHFGMPTSEYKRYYNGQISNAARQKDVGLIPEIRKIRELKMKKTVLMIITSLWICSNINVYSQELTDNQEIEITAEISALFDKNIKAAENLDVKELTDCVNDTLKAGFIENGKSCIPICKIFAKRDSKSLS